MYAWLFGSFAGWLFRCIIYAITIPLFALIRIFTSGDFASRKSGKLTKAQLSEAEEKRRMAGCQDIVLEFAECLGFIGREAISRSELETLIDSGISPQDLAQAIRDRIDDFPGVMLGHMQPPNESIPIKLPHTLRDRHMYII
jgi:hypothetical protein